MVSIREICQSAAKDQPSRISKLAPGATSLRPSSPSQHLPAPITLLLLESTLCADPVRPTRGVKPPLLPAQHSVLDDAVIPLPHDG